MSAGFFTVSRDQSETACQGYITSSSGSIFILFTKQLYAYNLYHVLYYEKCQYCSPSTHPMDATFASNSPAVRFMATHSTIGGLASRKCRIGMFRPEDGHLYDVPIFAGSMSQNASTCAAASGVNALYKSLPSRPAPQMVKPSDHGGTLSTRVSSARALC